MAEKNRNRGAGRPLKFKGASKVIFIRVPADEADTVKAEFEKILENYKAVPA
jgi:hypothetical protein